MRSWRLAPILLLSALAVGCIAPAPVDVVREARGIWSVTWSVREAGPWDADAATELAEARGFEAEHVGDVLLATKGEREMLRFTPRAPGVVVTLTEREERPVAPGEDRAAAARAAREAYEPDAAATLVAFESAFGWERIREGTWTHTTYRLAQG